MAGRTDTPGKLSKSGFLQRQAGRVAGATVAFQTREGTSPDPSPRAVRGQFMGK